MIDIHTHILPGIDDGAPDLDTSMEMLKIAVGDGTHGIITTPHFIQGSMNNDASRVRSLCDTLREQAAEAGLNIGIYPGNEVFICFELPELLENGTIATLNGSMYVLIELPMASMPEYTSEVLYQVRLRGYTPIIAHPCRYAEVMRDPNIVYDLIKKGALMQVNATSINGIYGHKIQETALSLLRHGMVHFIASDAHTCRGRAPKLQKCRTMVEEEVGTVVAQTLFEDNGNKVLKNEQITAGEPEKIQKKKVFAFSSLFRWFPGKKIGV